MNMVRCHIKKILFFEDCYCQIEILPQENYDYCMEQAKISQAFDEAHFQGLGYSDVLARQPAPHSICMLKLSEHALNTCLQSAQMIKQEVYTEYDNFSEPCEDMFAYASDSNNIILFFEKEDDIISTIWLSLDVKSAEDFHMAKTMLSAISSLGGLIIADWGWRFIELIRNEYKIAEYLNKRLKVFTAL